MSELKMSDVFELPLKMAVNELAVIDRSDTVVGWADAFAGEIARDSIVEAVNSHDRSAEENKMLRDDRNAAVAQMSKSWQHNHESQTDLLARYVSMAEYQFKIKDAEIKRLTAIATKHAVRADELYEALDNLLGSTNQKLAGEDGYLYWATTVDEDFLNEAQKILDKSRKEAEE